MNAEKTLPRVIRRALAVGACTAPIVLVGCSNGGQSGPSTTVVTVTRSSQSSTPSTSAAAPNSSAVAEPKKDTHSQNGGTDGNTFVPEHFPVRNDLIEGPPELQGKTIVSCLGAEHPGQYDPGLTLLDDGTRVWTAQCQMAYDYGRADIAGTDDYSESDSDYSDTYDDGYSDGYDAAVEEYEEALEDALSELEDN
ncbi:hypothetical protein [Corynebacterium aquilae]|uniref:Uncharacterized protein n=1 Tax=Corynebacterium aquilae DSM 44791 TaxID=1431546 RepID=A0A1L7CE27_9CORY|nr:hypothetical protein [Corynebacterium aquilae]APT84033.1 hypothetical protein CAQU_01920 [Corynebacterium aquilae DSM 44791]